jgi:putative two-component system response regulator
MIEAPGKPVILAVDDAPENLDVVKGALGSEYIIKAAINGQIALKIAEKAPPSLILLDIMMPGMDGFEVCRQLKSNDHTVNIPIVFLTGEQHHLHESRALDMGAVGFITKPINVETLKGCIRDILN